MKEDVLEAHAVVFATLTTFYWLLWDEMCKIGIEFGLQESEVKDILKEVVPAIVEIYLE